MPTVPVWRRRQVGVMRRVCIVIGNDGEMIELVNPEIIESDGEQTGPEGCLSLPGRYGLVTRPNHVRVRANDRNGNVFEVEGIELTARCFCHEIEHLVGHLFDDARRSFHDGGRFRGVLRSASGRN